MGHNEEPPTLVGCPNFCRAEQARFDAKAQLAKVLEDGGGSQGQVPFDVFEEAPFGIEIGDDPADMGPQVPGIVFPEALAGKGKRLAGISASEDMNLATPRAAVEGGNIVPDRRFIQSLVLHPCHDSGRNEGFPLDVTNSSVSGLGDMQAEFEASDASAEGDPGEGIRFRGM